MFLHIVLFFAVFFGGFIAIIVTVKMREVRAAARWPSVLGEIISSKSSAKTVTTHHATSDENEDKVEKRNFARITYRYTVGGKQYTCSRLSIGEDLGNDDVRGKLERYPKGRTVEVFYNPEKPGKAVLERGLPDGCAKAGLLGVALLITIIAVFGYGLDYAVIRIAPHLKHPDRASMVIFAATFSALCAWFSLMMWYQGYRASKWPRTRGRIETVPNPTWQTIILYSYKVDGVSYQSNTIDFGGNSRSTFRLASGVMIKGGVPDQDVEVFYDPADPSKACLYAGSRMMWLPLLATAFTAVLAWYLAGN
ncbi:MAG: DUF3592 domain-containing protein [Chthoniobacteraceae bacterium]